MTATNSIPDENYYTVDAERHISAFHLCSLYEAGFEGKVAIDIEMDNNITRDDQDRLAEAFKQAATSILNDPKKKYFGNRSYRIVEVEKGSFRAAHTIQTPEGNMFLTMDNTIPWDVQEKRVEALLRLLPFSKEEIRWSNLGPSGK